jgi:hypothetical protein
MIPFPEAAELLAYFVRSKILRLFSPNFGAIILLFDPT